MPSVFTGRGLFVQWSWIRLTLLMKGVVMTLFRAFVRSARCIVRMFFALGRSFGRMGALERGFE